MDNITIPKEDYDYLVATILNTPIKGDMGFVLKSLPEIERLNKIIENAKIQYDASNR